MRARPGDPENTAGECAFLASEADAELDAEIAFFVAPGVNAVGAGEGVSAVKVMTLASKKNDFHHVTPV